MISMVDCPHCSTRVLPMAGRVCPACRQDVDAPPDPKPKPEPVAEAAYVLAAERMRQGVAPGGIAKALTDRGLDAEAAANVVGNLEQVRSEAYKEQGRKNMLFGALWCFGGIALTAVSFRMASGAGGGKVFLAWGAILFGGIQFARGLIQSAEK